LTFVARCSGLWVWRRAAPAAPPPSARAALTEPLCRAPRWPPCVLHTPTALLGAHSFISLGAQQLHTHDRSRIGGFDHMCLNHVSAWLEVHMRIPQIKYVTHTAHPDISYSTHSEGAALQRHNARRPVPPSDQRQIPSPRTLHKDFYRTTQSYKYSEAHSASSSDGSPRSSSRNVQ
jgi:hypothetical protein